MLLDHTYRQQTTPYTPSLMETTAPVCSPEPVQAFTGLGSTPKTTRQSIPFKHYHVLHVFLLLPHRSHVSYKKPLVRLGARLRLLFRLGTDIIEAVSSSTLNPVRQAPRTLPMAEAAPFSNLNALMPSSSRSRRMALSFSSRSSRSARRAWSWFSDSDD
ncbi:hypothetical protein LZ32DRAFT_366992 [Colletotrichum eremochloae]|nr:hypothetical protein LZ32DRAFT_366992 [Colletotrichum eremochloae]